MKKVLITSTEAYASGCAGSYQLTSLAAGAIAAFDPSITGTNANLVDSAGSNIVGKEIYFAVGNSEVEALLSPLINKESLSFYKKEYTAPVAKVMTFGKSGATITWPSLVAGHVYGFKVVDLDKPVEDTSRIHTIDYVLTAADAADDDVAIASIAAALNADTEIAKIMTTTVYNTDDGFVFTGAAYTGLTKQHNFTVIATGKFVDNATASIATTTELVTGFGCSWQVIDEYIESMIERGYNPHHSGLQEGLWNLTSLVVTATTYDAIGLTWKALKSERRGQIDVEGNFNQELIIYIPSTHTTTETIEAILAAFTGS